METITLTVNGMHCEACKALLRMELEENGYDSNIEAIELTPKQTQGTIRLANVTDQQITAITNLINTLDQYTVV